MQEHACECMAWPLDEAFWRCTKSVQRSVPVTRAITPFPNQRRNSGLYRDLGPRSRATATAALLPFATAMSASGWTQTFEPDVSRFARCQDQSLAEQSLKRLIDCLNRPLGRRKSDQFSGTAAQVKDAMVPPTLGGYQANGEKKFKHASRRFHLLTLRTCSRYLFQ